MSDPQVFALVATLGILVALGACYVHPRTRPYARKWGWLVLVPLAFLAGVALLGGRQREEEASEGDGGAAAGEASKRAVRELADYALAASADADADLALRRLEATADTDVALADLVVFRASVAEARDLDDAAARRAELIALVESTR